MQLKSSSTTLNGVFHTGQEMVRLAVDYNDDVAAFDSYTLPQFYNLVKSLTYKKDPPGIEHISRPAATLSKNAIYRDCDDKAVTVASFIHRQNKKGKLNIPWRFVAVSKNPTGSLHHVLIEAMVRGDSKFIDATYPRNELFKSVNYTAFKPISEWRK